MPNWVSNSVVIYNPKGKPKAKDAEGIQEVKVRDLYDLLTAENFLSDNGDGEITFHNLITPDPTLWADYKGTGWYNWNLEHWGTKWDACEPQADVYASSAHGGIEILVASFDTAWSPPENVIEALMDYCRKNKLVIEWRFEEEQGWGGIISRAENGDETAKTWDIPQSHAEHEEVGKECYCEWSSSPEDWYPDCPATIELELSQSE